MPLRPIRRCGRPAKPPTRTTPPSPSRAPRGFPRSMGSPVSTPPTTGWTRRPFGRATTRGRPLPDRSRSGWCTQHSLYRGGKRYRDAAPGPPHRAPEHCGGTGCPAGRAAACCHHVPERPPGRTDGGAPRGGAGGVRGARPGGACPVRGGGAHPQRCRTGGGRTGGCRHRDPVRPERSLRSSGPCWRSSWARHQAHSNPRPSPIPCCCRPRSTTPAAPPSTWDRPCVVAEHALRAAEHAMRAVQGEAGPTLDLVGSMSVTNKRDRGQRFFLPGAPLTSPDSAATERRGDISAGLRLRVPILPGRRGQGPAEPGQATVPAAPRGVDGGPAGSGAEVGERLVQPAGRAGAQRWPSRPPWPHRQLHWSTFGTKRTSAGVRCGKCWMPSASWSSRRLTPCGPSGTGSWKAIACLRPWVGSGRGTCGSGRRRTTHQFAGRRRIRARPE